MIDTDRLKRDALAFLGIRDEVLHVGLDPAKPGSDRTAIAILQRSGWASPKLERMRSAFERDLWPRIVRTCRTHIPRVKRRQVPPRRASARGCWRRAQALQGNARARRNGPPQFTYDVQVIDPLKVYKKPASPDLVDAISYAFTALSSEGKPMTRNAECP